MRWDTTKDGNSDGDSDSGHILFYTMMIYITIVVVIAIINVHIK